VPQRAFTPTYLSALESCHSFLSFFLWVHSFLSPRSSVLRYRLLTLYTPAVSRGDALPSHRGSVFPGVFGCCLQQEETHSPKYARPIWVLLQDRRNAEPNRDGRNTESTGDRSKRVPACGPVQGPGLLRRGVSQGRRMLLFPVLIFYPSKWSAFTQSDPTHGLVQYVSHDTAQSEGLAQVLPNGAAVLSVDNTTDLPLNTPRKSCVLLCPQTFVEIPTQLRPPSFNSSIRIITTKKYNGGLFIADFERMPFGCSLWPAYWSFGTDSWPANGEIDILEGVNDQVTLVIPPPSPFFRDVRVLQ